jgi:hypothetical protein
MPAQATLTSYKISLSLGNFQGFPAESEGWIARQDIHQIVSVRQESEYQVNNNCPVPVVTHR